MNKATYIEHLRRNADLLVTAGSAHFDAAVPTCPDWTGEQIIGHTAWVFRFAQHCLSLPEDGTIDRRSISASPPGEAVIDDYKASLDSLVSVLTDVDIDRPAVTFVGVRPAQWWARRMAQETAMHRWDAQSAGPAQDPIDAELAADGIDEALEVMTPRRFDNEAFGPNGETMHLHATDADGEWMIEFGTDGVTWRHGHEKGAVAAKGTASDLLLFFYSRLPASRLEVFGDAEILSRYQQAAAY